MHCCGRSSHLQAWKSPCQKRIQYPFAESWLAAAAQTCAAAGHAIEAAMHMDGRGWLQSLELHSLGQIRLSPFDAARLPWGFLDSLNTALQ